MWLKNYLFCFTNKTKFCYVTCNISSSGRSISEDTQEKFSRSCLLPPKKMEKKEKNSDNNLKIK